MTTQDNHYRTSDTVLAAFLIIEHFFVISIDYSKPRFEFLFKDSEQIREAANNYISGNALTDPTKFARVLRKCNRIIYKKIQWEADWDAIQ